MRHINCVLFLPFERTTDIETLSSLESAYFGKLFNLSASHFLIFKMEKTVIPRDIAQDAMGIMVVKCNS